MVTWWPLWKYQMCVRFSFIFTPPAQQRTAQRTSPWRGRAVTCFLLPSNYQHLVETLKKVEIINCNSTNFISVVPFAMKSVAEAHFLPLLRFILFNFTSCPQRLNSTVNTIQPFIGKSMMVCVWIEYGWQMWYWMNHNIEIERWVLPPDTTQI